jgi:hypothetical protein
MKRINTYVLVFLMTSVAFSFTSCKKPDAGLTKATQIGANTFSCKVNGESFFPKQDLFGPKPIVVYVNQNKGIASLYLSANQYDNYLQSMSFHVADFKGVGTYYFKEPIITVSSTGSTLINVPDIYVQQRLNSISGDFFAKDGQLIISRYDSGILSGTFEYTFANGTDIVKITYGRFDLKL